MLYYRIATQGDRLAMCADRAGKKINVTTGPIDDYQLWGVHFHPTNEWNVGVILVNKGTGKMAVSDYTREGAAVEQTDIPDRIVAEMVWQTNVAGSSNNIRSIMPLLDEDRCIRYIAGHVGTFGWSGGGDGELWTFSPVLR